MIEVNLTLLEEYFDKVKYPVCFLIGAGNPSYLRVQAGKPEMNGGLNITLEFNDLDQILRTNNIIGPGSEVDTLIKDSKENFVSHGEKIDDLIYETLVKYISQMLLASLGEILDPNIIPLDKHRDTYFRERVKS